MAKYHLYIRAIPGYPGYYATIEGDILKKRGNSFFKLTPSKVHNDYYTVKIIHRVKVHRLVALTFIPNPNNYPIVCHKDNNPCNNRAENLYWGTQSHNMQQMVRDGRQRKSKIVNYKTEVLLLHSHGFSISEIAESVAISKTSVNRIIKGKI